VSNQCKVPRVNIRSLKVKCPNSVHCSVFFKSCCNDKKGNNVANGGDLRLMIQRSVKPSKKNEFFLFGARGTGKSTWLQESFMPDDHLWIDLTNPKEERRYSRRPEILLDEWHDFTKSRRTKSATKPWIVIDEVQKIPAILDVVHVGIQRHKIKFELTGSSARKLKRGAANLLAGRALTYRMHPFTYSELGGAF